MTRLSTKSIESGPIDSRQDPVRACYCSCKTAGIGSQKLTIDSNIVNNIYYLCHQLLLIMNTDIQITKELFLAAQLFEKVGDRIFAICGLTIKTHEVL